MRLVLLPSAAAHRRVTPSYTSFLSLLFLVAVTFSPSFQFQVASSFSTKTSSKMATIKNIVVVGGGIQGVSVAYQLVQKSKSKAKANGDNNEKLKITILESKEPASAASGKGGGFMARSWGDGSPTQSLHHVSFDMYEDVAKQIGCTSYRKLPVISVSPEGGGGVSKATSNNNSQLKELIPSWLDGKSIGRISPMGYGDDTAQITPKEFVTKMLDATSNEGVSVVLGTCTGMETETIPTDDDNDDDSEMKVTGVRYQPRSGSGEEDEEDEENSEVEEQIIKADVVVISAGPWSCKAEDWFLKSNIQLPMEGVKSTSIVWKQPKQLEKDGGVDATALFCGEDDRYQTHLEVYPRPDGTIYICGIGGSDYITKDELKDGAYRETISANESRVKAASNSFKELSTIYKDKGELDRTQACMRPCPPDALPYMGHIPNYTNAYINAGHNCWGIAWAPGAGKVMSELILDGKAQSINIDPFNPGRFSPNVAKKRGGRGRKQQGTNVGEQW